MINTGLRKYIYSARLYNNIELEAKDFIEYGNREEVNDVYTVEYKEVPVVVKKWVRV